jgi:hypothetical protein
MQSSLGVLIRPASLAAAVILLAVFVANGQTAASSTATAQEQVATTVNASGSKAAASNAPLFSDYRGVSIGMAADDVRGKLDGIKKGDSQDYLATSDHESAQIYYDADGKVTAISIDYFGGESNAPTPETVLGTAIHAKADGSMYELKRYPGAGYWVSYNRTAGDKPIVTVTMQKMR